MMIVDGVLHEAGGSDMRQVIACSPSVMNIRCGEIFHNIFQKISGYFCKCVSKSSSRGSGGKLPPKNHNPEDFSCIS